MTQVSPSNSPWTSSNFISLVRNIKDPLCAGAAIFPFLPLMIIKSAMQADDPAKRRTFMQIFKNEFNANTALSVLIGCIKASGALGLTLGVQLKLQEGLVSLYKKQATSPQYDNVVNSAGIPTAVAILTTPGLIGFNGLTMKQGFFNSMKKITREQYIATVVREMFFLASIQFSGLATQQIQNTFGENKTAKHASHFFVGFLGAAFGHAADTYLTQLQKNTLQQGVKISLRNLRAGFVPRTCAVGGFNTAYQQLKSTANSQLELYSEKKSSDNKTSSV